ncbi:MAG: TatD family hydrolase [Euryarchaeota archaeon]|nr:TatD family hydrolase [Euryarchaeota archaeon]
MLDVHCHLTHPAFEPDRAEVLERARRVLSGAVVSSTNLDEAPGVLALAGAYPGFLHATLGFHPMEVPRTPDAAIRGVEEFLRAHQGEMRAIGEIGFDYHHVTDPIQQARMREAAGRLLALAVDLDLPAVLHMRNAPPEDYRFILDSGARCLFHCWTASRTLAGEVAARGALLSLGPGVWKFKNPRRVAQSLPLGALVTESDAPFFGLGVRNEPGEVPRVVEEIARLRGEPVERVARATEENARRFYRL